MKPNETAGFSDIYGQDFSGYLEVIKQYICINGEKKCLNSAPTYNTCAIGTQVNKRASVARIIFVGFFGFLFTSRNKILLDKHINKKLSTKLKHI